MEINIRYDLGSPHVEYNCVLTLDHEAEQLLGSQLRFAFAEELAKGKIKAGGFSTQAHYCMNLPLEEMFSVLAILRQQINKNIDVSTS